MYWNQSQWTPFCANQKIFEVLENSSRAWSKYIILRKFKVKIIQEVKVTYFINLPDWDPFFWENQIHCCLQANVFSWSKKSNYSLWASPSHGKHANFKLIRTNLFKFFKFCRSVIEAAWARMKTKCRIYW